MTTPAPDFDDRRTTGTPSLVNDPIRLVRELRRLEFVRSRPRLSADSALVLIAGSGRARTYSADRQPTRGELVVGDLRMLYEVDLGRHHQYFEFRLPSSGDAFFFDTEVDVTWWVDNPEVVVRRAVRDVRARIEPAIRRVTAQRTREFAIEKNAEAEDAVNRALEQAGIGVDDGLRVECSVRLGLDSDALAHFAALRRSDYEKAQAAAEHEGQKAATRHEQEIVQAKVDHFNQLISHDDNMWSLMLARNPDDIPLVLEGRRADERAAMATRLQLIQKMLESGQLEPHMLEEPTQIAVETLREILGSAAEGSTTRRPLYKERLQAPDHELPVRPDDDR